MFVNASNLPSHSTFRNARGVYSLFLLRSRCITVMARACAQAQLGFDPKHHEPSWLLSALVYAPVR